VTLLITIIKSDYCSQDIKYNHYTESGVEPTGIFYDQL